MGPMQNPGFMNPNKVPGSIICRIQISWAPFQVQFRAYTQVKRGPFGFHLGSLLIWNPFWPVGQLGAHVYLSGAHLGPILGARWP